MFTSVDFNKYVRDLVTYKYIIIMFTSIDFDLLQRDCGLLQSYLQVHIVFRNK